MLLKCCKRGPFDYQPIPYEPNRSNACKEQMKTHKIVLAIIATDVGEVALVLFCFNKKGMTGDVLNPKVYDYINLAISSAFLLRSVMHPSRKLQDPRDAGVCSHEFLMAAVAMEIIIYSAAFFNTQELSDFNRNMMYGFSIGMVSASFLMAACKNRITLDPPRRASNLEEKLFLESRGEFCEKV